MAEEYNCDICNKTYMRKGYLTKHMARHSDEEREQVRGDGGNLLVLMVPDDFPELDVEDLGLAEDAADVQRLLNQSVLKECDECEEKDKEDKVKKETVKRLLQKIKSLEKSKKTLQKLNKDQKNDLENTRELLDKATKENTTFKLKRKPDTIIELEDDDEEVTEQRVEMEVLDRSLECKVCKLKCFDESELNHHMRTKHKKEKDEDALKCEECNYRTPRDYTTSDLKAFMEHKKKEHGSKSNDKAQKPLCSFFLQDKCTRTPCLFRHEAKKTSSHKRDKKSEPCKKGPQCKFEKENRCDFFHLRWTPSSKPAQLPKDCDLSRPPPKVPQEKKQARKSHENTQKLWCKFQERCKDGETTCKFRHFGTTSTSTLSPTTQGNQSQL